MGGPRRYRGGGGVVEQSVAERYGQRWSAGAAVRAERFADMSRPAWVAVAAAAGIGPGLRVLDVACGSGEFGRLAADRGRRRGRDRRGGRDDRAGRSAGPRRRPAGRHPGVAALAGRRLRRGHRVQRLPVRPRPAGRAGRGRPGDPPRRPGGDLQLGPGRRSASWSGWCADWTTCSPASAGPAAPARRPGGAGGAGPRGRAAAGAAVRWSTCPTAPRTPRPWSGTCSPPGTRGPPSSTPAWTRCAPRWSRRPPRSAAPTAPTCSATPTAT